MVYLINWISLFSIFLQLALHVNGMMVSPAPVDVQSYMGKIGQSFCLDIIALREEDKVDQIWGNKVYTSDSRLRTAVIHDGWAQKGQTVQVIVKIVEGKSDYERATRNGIASASYSSWVLSYSFVDYCCKDGQYNIPKDPTCSDCQVGCATCTGSANNCQSCIDGFGLVGSKCEICPDGMYSHGPTLPCSKCKPGCANCESDITKCNEVSQGYYFTDSSVTQCPSKTTSPGGKVTTCDQSCSSACERCQTPSICQKCDVGYLLVNTDTGSSCEACSEYCDVCDNLVTCQKCNHKSTLINDKCLECGPGSFSNVNGTCKTCSPNCVECTDADTCQKCLKRYEIDQNFQCVLPRPPWKEIKGEYIMLICLGSVAVFSVAAIYCLKLLFAKRRVMKYDRTLSESPNEKYRISSFNDGTQSPEFMDE